MSTSGSVTYWVRELQAGNHLAAEKLWQGYFHRLVSLARTKLKNRPRRAADEEDVALSAFASFCRGAEQGRFPQLADRDDLWQLLVLITGRKAADLVQHVCRQKRGGGRVCGDSALAGPRDSTDSVEGLEQVLGSEPTPEFAAQVADECRRTPQIGAQPITTGQEFEPHRRQALSRCPTGIIFLLATTASHRGRFRTPYIGTPQIGAKPISMYEKSEPQEARPSFCAS
jgi:hypothetical protein